MLFEWFHVGFVDDGRPGEGIVPRDEACPTSVVLEFMMKPQPSIWGP